jgi:hypothetical protein
VKTEIVDNSESENVLNRIRAIRGGKFNEPRFCSRMRGKWIFADPIS